MAKKIKSKAMNCKNLFEKWWSTASKKVEKIEKKWTKENEPNDPEEESGGDHWYVNQMMHDGEAYNMTYDSAEEAFQQGFEGQELETDRLYCELDNIVSEAYEAGKSKRNDAQN